MGRPGKELFYDSQYTSDTITVSLSTTSARNAAVLAPGFYRVYASAECFIKQGDSAVTVTATTGAPVPAGRYFPAPIFVDKAASGFIAGITASGTTTLFIVPVKEGAL